jgi:hypothetical protein
MNGNNYVNDDCTVVKIMGLMMIKCRKGTIINDDDHVMVASILMMKINVHDNDDYSCLQSLGMMIQ